MSSGGLTLSNLCFFLCIMRNIVIHILLIIIFYIISIRSTFDPQENTVCFLMPTEIPSWKIWECKETWNWIEINARSTTPYDVSHVVLGVGYAKVIGKLYSLKWDPCHLSNSVILCVKCSPWKLILTLHGLKGQETVNMQNLILNNRKLPRGKLALENTTNQTLYSLGLLHPPSHIHLGERALYAGCPRAARLCTSWRTVSTAQNPRGGTDQVCSAPAITLLWGRWKSPRCTWPSEQCTLRGRLGLQELSAEQHKVDPLWSTDPPSSLGLVDLFSLCNWTLFQSSQH